MLLSLLALPTLGGALVLCLPERTDAHRRRIWGLALATAVGTFLASVALWAHFDTGLCQVQRTVTCSPFGAFALRFGVDGLSLYYVLLTAFVTPVALLANAASVRHHVRPFVASLLVLETLQLATFLSLDLLLFYVCFESVLPLLFALIVLYGHGADRVRSALLLFLYTLGASLPMLLSVLAIAGLAGTTDLHALRLDDVVGSTGQRWLWLGFFVAFAVKTPLYPFSLWLPRAHADSPLAGSILLAGTVLKLATYGYLRILLPLLPDASLYFGPAVQTVAAVSVLYASLATVVQEDTKKLVAYSSVAHMGVVVLGLFSNALHGIEGGVLLSLAHGFVSPALFLCVGGVLYERTGTRLYLYTRGVATHMPLFALLFLLFTLCNAGVPLSLNFAGEQLALMGAWERNPWAAVLGATGIVLSACYSVYIYNRLAYGGPSPYLTPVRDLDRREGVLLLSLLLPTLLLGVCPNPLLDPLHGAVTALLRPL